MAAVEAGFKLALRGFVCEAVAIDREAEFPTEDGQALGVILVFVREEDSGKRLGRPADGGEPLADLAAAEARIDQEADFGRLEVGAIAAGPAAEDGELNGHGPTVGRARNWFNPTRSRPRQAANAV